MRWLLLPFTVLTVVACQTVPESEREQLIITSPEMEQALGEQAFDRLTQGSSFIREGEEYEMLQRVGERIVKVAQPELEARGFGDLEWSFHLVDRDMVNAFVVPSGQVVFMKGIMPVLEDEESVAFVMGHEVAHVIARHGGERVSRQMLIAGGSVLAASILTDNEDDARTMLGALGLAAMFGIQMPFSRSHELEAGDIGVRLMARAGYDPQSAIGVWSRMQEATINVPAFLSTHPPSTARGEAMVKQMPEYLMLREAALASHLKNDLDGH